MTEQRTPKPVNPSLKKPTAVYLFLGYFLWPFALIGLKLEQEDEFIRFHCAQAMAFFFLQLVICIVYFVLTLMTFFILIFLLPLVIALFVASYVLVILALIKAANGEKAPLPLLGNLAEKHIQQWFLGK